MPGATGTLLNVRSIGGSNTQSSSSSSGGCSSMVRCRFSEDCRDNLFFFWVVVFVFNFSLFFPNLRDYKIARDKTSIDAQKPMNTEKKECNSNLFFTLLIFEILVELDRCHHRHRPSRTDPNETLGEGAKRGRGEGITLLFGFGCSSSSNTKAKKKKLI